jgi:hypothetical protein
MGLFRSEAEKRLEAYLRDLGVQFGEIAHNLMDPLFMTEVRGPEATEALRPLVVAAEQAAGPARTLKAIDRAKDFTRHLLVAASGRPDLYDDYLALIRSV